MLIFRLACLSLALVKGKDTRNAKDFVSQHDYQYDYDDSDNNSEKIQDASGEISKADKSGKIGDISLPDANKILHVLPGDLVDENKLVKIAKAEEDLIFPEDDYDYTYDTNDDESNEKSSAVLIAPQNDLLNLAPLPQSDQNPNALLLNDVESGNGSENEQEVNLQGGSGFKSHFFIPYF